MKSTIELSLMCLATLATAGLNAGEPGKPTTISIGSVSIVPTKWDKDEILVRELNLSDLRKTRQSITKRRPETYRSLSGRMGE
jgi:hypothetical protein